MGTGLLNRRRRKLGIPVGALARMSGLPAGTVARVLTDPSAVRFADVQAVARVLGIDMLAGRRTPVRQILRERAESKARYVARLVQGTQGLEAAGLDPAGYHRLLEVSATALLAGKRRNLWDDD